MKAVILAGGLGTRLSEETTFKPKPLVEIGGRPILWHIMKYFSEFGIQEFIICLGYKGNEIKRFFIDLRLIDADVTVDLGSGEIKQESVSRDPWLVHLVNTGHSTETGGRLLKVRDYLDDDEDFFFTYGDGLTDANLNAELDFHRDHGLKATVLAVKPPGRFGALDLDGHVVDRFIEKPDGDRGYINGGYFILKKECLSKINGFGMRWEDEPLENLAEEKELAAFRHDGFWHPMDTQRDKLALNHYWEAGNAPWKIW